MHYFNDYWSCMFHSHRLLHSYQLFYFQILVALQPFASNYSTIVVPTLLITLNILTIHVSKSTNIYKNTYVRCFFRTTYFRRFKATKCCYTSERTSGQFRIKNHGPRDAEGKQNPRGEGVWVRGVRVPNRLASP